MAVLADDRTVHCKPMDFDRRSDIYRNNEDIPTKVLLDSADGRAHQSSEHGEELIEVKFSAGPNIICCN